MDYHQININEDSYLALLSLNTLPLSDKRKRESEGTKILLKKILNNDTIQLAYYDTGKPYLVGRSEHISISHSHDMLAVMIDKKNETGIDIELIRDKVLKITHKFLSTEEAHTIYYQNTEKAIVYWASKETLYKIYGKRNVDFKKQLAIENFEYTALGGDIIGHILMPDYKRSFNLRYQKISEYILVYPI